MSLGLITLGTRALGLGAAVTLDGIAGSLAWTEANDTASVSGSLTASATAAWAEANDTAAIAGAVVAAGGSTASWTEQDDAFAISGAVRVNALIAWLESDDSASIAASVALQPSGTIAWIEAGDSFQITGTSAAITFARAPVGGGFSRATQAMKRISSNNETRHTSSNTTRSRNTQ